MKPVKFKNGLKPNDNFSVQPNLLTRTPMFAPVSIRNSGKAYRRTSDISEEIPKLKWAKKEGYETVVISGTQLNMRTDFKVWCGIIRAMNMQDSCKPITLSLSEFTTLCGFSKSMINKKFRDRIDQSLFALASQTLHFSMNDGDQVCMTHLVQKASYDVKKDIIRIEPDPDLAELYAVDIQILISMETLNQIPRSETAQALYLFFSSLPSNPHPVSLTRLKERLRVTSPDSEAKRQIKSAIKTLENIGYVTGRETETPSGEWAYKIEHRRKTSLNKIDEA